MKDNTLAERITRVETNYENICKSVDEIKTNHLVHLNDKVDKLSDQVKDLSSKVALIVAAASLLAPIAVDLIKKFILKE